MRAWWWGLFGHGPRAPSVGFAATSPVKDGGRINPAFNGAFPVTGVVGGLPAASLRTRHLHEATGVFQQADRSESDAQAMQIDRAGDEQGDARRGMQLPLT